MLTNSKRIFKMDGWNPILELKDGLWIRPKNFQFENFSSANEISAEEANKNSYGSDCYIDSDNAKLYYSFTESVFASSAIKYKRISEISNLLINDKDFGDNKLVYDKSKQLFNWIDCLCSSICIFRTNKIFFEQVGDIKQFDILFFNNFVKYTLPALVRSCFSDLDNDDEMIISWADVAFEEFDKAAVDKERKERIFSSMTDFPPSDSNYAARIYYCFLNRTFFRLCGLEENELIYRKDAPFYVVDILSETLFLTYGAKFLEIAKNADSELLESVKKGEI